MEIKKIEEVVQDVLERFEDSRNDDFILIARVYLAMNENVVVRESFLELMINHKKYNLPSFASISRVRRKVFEKHPELKPFVVTKKREKLEEEYKEYSRT